MSTKAEAEAFYEDFIAGIAEQKAQLLAIHLNDPVADAIYHALLNSQGHYIDTGPGEYATIAREITEALDGALVPR